MKTKWQEECTATSYHLFILFYLYIILFFYYPPQDCKSNAGKECVAENEYSGDVQTSAIGP